MDGAIKLANRFPRVPAAWRLRNDGRYVVAYKSNSNELKHRVLLPGEAVIIPFLDGSLEYGEAFRLWRSFSGTAEIPTEAFDKLISGLVGNGILEWEGPASSSFLHRKNLIPDFSNYHRPSGRLDRPLGVFVTLTNRCDVNCRYCYAERRHSDEMDRNQLRTLFDDLATNNIFCVDIYGGDLFARKDIFGILEDMVEREFVFYISTKSHLSPEDARRLAELGIGRRDVPVYAQRPLQFSVDSSDPAMASSLVRRDGFLERIIESVRSAVAAGMAPRIKAVLTSLNSEAAEDLVALFTQFGVDDFQFVQYGLSYYRPDPSLLLSREQKLALSGVRECLHARYPNLRLTVQNELSMGGSRTKTWEDWRQRSVCSGGRLNMVVKPNGDVTVCEQVPHQPPFVVGNVVRQGLLGVWDSKEMYAFLNPSRELFSSAICYTCKEFTNCHDNQLGYCYRDALFNYGTMYEAPSDCPRQTNIGLRQV